MAYNEEKNIGRLLQTLLDQKLEEVQISNIFVISSGCTDKTEEIVKEFSQKDERIKLLTQEKREGKPSAINFFIKNAKRAELSISSSWRLKSPLNTRCLV